MEYSAHMLAMEIMLKQMLQMQLRELSDQNSLPYKENVQVFKVSCVANTQFMGFTGIDNNQSEAVRAAIVAEIERMTASLV